MIDYTEIAHDSDHWELFARDFLSALGLHIETPPNRGADGGKDLLVSEEVRGVAYVGRFRWLVSCKHFATSGRSVSANSDEADILERVRAFGARGFIGFYSTLASSGLSDRLERLRSSSDIDDFRVFDGKLIENHLVTSGYSNLLLRYFPNSYAQLRPLHPILGPYEPLRCKFCNKDLLIEAVLGRSAGNFVRVYHSEDSDPTRYIDTVYVSCKTCDRPNRRNLEGDCVSTDWNELEHLFIPVEFLRWICGWMNGMRSEDCVYSESAFEEQKSIVIRIAQRVLRYTTESERERVATLMLFSGL